MPFQFQVQNLNDFLYFRNSSDSLSIKAACGTSSQSTGRAKLRAVLSWTEKGTWITYITTWISSNLNLTVTSVGMEQLMYKMERADIVVLCKQPSKSIWNSGSHSNHLIYCTWYRYSLLQFCEHVLCIALFDYIRIELDIELFHDYLRTNKLPVIHISLCITITSFLKIIYIMGIICVYVLSCYHQLKKRLKLWP